MRMMLQRALIAMMSLALTAPVARAQTGRGTIQGRVTDALNAVLQGATVTVTPGGAHGVSDAEGEYVQRQHAVRRAA